MKHALQYAFDRLLERVGVVLRPFFRSENRSEKVVLISALGGVGDYLLLTPVLHCYRSLFPRTRVVLIARKGIRELVARSPYVDDFIGVRYERFGGDPRERLRIWWSLLRYRADLFINADYSTAHDWMERTIVWWSRARRSVAFACGDRHATSPRDEFDELLNGLDPLLFEIERHALMLRFLGSACTPGDRPVIWGLERHVLPAGLKQEIGSSPYFAVFPGSYTAKKCWPAEKFLELLRRLSDIGLVPVILGGGQDPLVRDTEEGPRQVVDLVGRTSLLDLATIIAGARFLVSNDTSAAHIGAAVGAHTFVLLGGGHWGRFFPYPGSSGMTTITAEQYRVCHGCGWECLYDRFRCVEQIEVDAVEIPIRAFLERDVKR